MYAVLTGKLTGLMELLPENKSSELSHPDWRGPFLVAEKQLARGKLEERVTPHLHLASSLKMMATGF